MSNESAKSNSSHKASPTIQLNKKYEDINLKQKLQEAYRQNQSFTEEGAGLFVYNKPFMCCCLPNFVENESSLADLKDELLDLEFFEKNNDLYKFHQSDDLKDSEAPNISALRTFLYGDFRKWIQEITGFNLTANVDMNCARYDYTDILLCHDDMLEGRKIAYILYLVPNWKKDDGGLLDLFSCNDNGEPSEIVPVQSIIPEWNSFVFFEVSHSSFHQVSEVLTEDKTRLSISGWFYGDPIEKSPVEKQLLEASPPIFVGELPILEWINSSYLNPETQVEIRQKFEADSEVELLGFFNEDKYKAVAAALQGCALEWQTQGPINKRHYDTLDPSMYPPIVKECLDILHSEALFLILSNITGLTLHKLAVEDDDEDDSDTDPEENNEEPSSKRQKKDDSGTSSGCEQKHDEKEVDAKCFSEIRLWKHGSYTLIHDDCNEGSEFALDAILFLNCKDWCTDFGGYVSYVAKDEDEELLSVTPQENALALVFRDKETLSFVKHINHRVTSRGNSSHFHTITSIYYE